MHTVQSPVLSRMHLFLKLHLIADCWTDPTLSATKRNLFRGRREKNELYEIFFFFLFSCFFWFCFFVCKPRHQQNHNPPANSKKAAVTVKRTFKIQLHSASYNPEPCCSKFGSPGSCILWVLITPEAKLGTALALSREEVQDTATTQSNSSPPNRPGVGK